MKHFYIFTCVIFSLVGQVFAQSPLTDRIIIEFMEPGDLDATARNYHLLPWPEEAKEPAYKAAEIWASYLEITVPIRVKFGWCDNITPDAHGAATYSYEYADGYYYPLPLINQLLGYDRNKDAVDIICVFKSNIKNGWYFGIDGKVGVTPDPNDPLASYFQEDFVTVAMHEICHGLGFSTTMDVVEGKGKWGGLISRKPVIYDTFLTDKDGNQLIDETIYRNNTEKLAKILTSNEVYWKGYCATIANNGNLVKIHSSDVWEKGTSLSHLDQIYARTENNVMAYGLGGTLNADGLGVTYYHGSPLIVLGMLQDMGWTLKDTPTANESITASSLCKVYSSMNQIVIEGIENHIPVAIFDISGRPVFSDVGPNRVALPSGMYIVRIGESQSLKINVR